MNISKSKHLLPSEQVIIKKAKSYRSHTVDLRGLSLSKLSTDLSSLVEFVVKLDLSFNSFVSLPSHVFELNKLRELSVSHNRLATLSERLCSLDHLEILDVSHNCLPTLPKCLGTMPCIKMVNCAGNNLKTVEAVTLSAPTLSCVSFTRNPIGNVPPDVYLKGLAVLRKHFGISTPVASASSISQSVCANDKDKSFWERHVEIKARRTKKRKRLKELDIGCEPTSHQTLPQRQQGGSAGRIQTSDYGSGTPSVQDANLDQWEGGNIKQSSDKESSSCYCDHGSEGDSHLSGCSDLSDWSNDSWEELDRPDFGDVTEQMDCILPNRSRFLKLENVAIMIPEHNKMNRRRSEFYLDIINDVSLHPEMKPSWVAASPVVSIGPDGTEFYKDSPAFIRLPLKVKLGNGKVRCLCSNSSEFERPSWTELHASEFRVMGGFVVIRTLHLSFFTAVLDLSPALVSTVVTPEDGGRLDVDQVPGVKVIFPVGSVQEPIRASVKVLSGDLDEKLRTNLDANDAVATPVVVLSPHGYLFREGDKKPVHVHLPIPNYRGIIQQYGPLAKFSLWQSRTSEDDPISWQRLPDQPKLYCNDQDEYFVDVPVSHFSWLTGMWEGIKNSVGYSYQGGAQSMKCQAWMLENKESNKFGLVVICHNADKNIQEFGNYTINVGGSLKPVSVDPGR